jgi:pteridine reductase
MGEFPLALVTGGARRLGRSFALALARNGFAILLHYYRSLDGAARAEEEIKTLGVPVFSVQADLTDSNQIQKIFSVLDQTNLRLRVLVNSAACLRRIDLRKASGADWDMTLDLNLTAPFLLSQKASERMVEGGLIVNVTDAGVGKAWTRFPAYQVSKTGLEMLTRLQARSFAPRIRVNAIAPGLVFPSSEISAEEWEKLVNHLPLQRPVPPEDITSALEFILKNESITGQTIFVDGGYSLL